MICYMKRSASHRWEYQTYCEDLLEVVMKVLSEGVSS